MCRPDGFDTKPLLPGTMVRFSGFLKSAGDAHSVAFDRPTILGYESHLGTARRLIATNDYWAARCIRTLRDTRTFGDDYVLTQSDDVRINNPYMPFGADVEVHLAYQGRAIPGIPTPTKCSQRHRSARESRPPWAFGTGASSCSSPLARPGPTTLDTSISTTASINRSAHKSARCQRKH